MHKEKYYDHLYTTVHVSIKTIMTNTFILEKRLMNFMIDVINGEQTLAHFILHFKPLTFLKIDELITVF